MRTMSTLIERLRGGLIVSCQARPGSPVYGPKFMAAFAQCAELAGAAGLRVNGSADVRAVRRAVKLPIIGINKLRTEQYPVYITPSLQAARQVLRAGADMVAIDATHRAREGGLSPEHLITMIHETLNCPVMADVDSIEEGIAAAQAGADLVATTMAGYTNLRPMTDGPDLDLVRELASRIQVPVICEGRIQRPNEVKLAFEAGAYAVVVGTAITNPRAIAQAFVFHAPGAKPWALGE
jgi:putative N-acetylmannosamine-6-phosphate epimerase